MWLSPESKQELAPSMHGVTGDKSVDVRKAVVPSKGYTNTVLGSGALFALRNAARGKSKTRVLASMMGVNPVGLLDTVGNPVASTMQSRADVNWLRSSRVNDRLQPSTFSFNKSSDENAMSTPSAVPVTVHTYSAHQARSAYNTFKLSAALHATCLRGVRFLPTEPMEKTASGDPVRVKISSPLEKRSNLKAVLRETQGKMPYDIPGTSRGGVLSDAWKNRPEFMGGPSKGQKILGSLKEFLVQDQMVYNASGVPVERKKVFLPGMLGKMLRVPLAVGGLAGMNALYQGAQDKKHRASSESRFQSTLQELRDGNTRVGDQLNPDQVDLEDPDDVDAFKNRMQTVRHGFDILDTHAKTVAKDPKLAAGFLEGFLAGDVDGEGVLNPDEYMSQVRGVVDLNASIERGQDASMFDGLTSLVPRFLDAE